MHFLKSKTWDRPKSFLFRWFTSQRWPWSFRRHCGTSKWRQGSAWFSRCLDLSRMNLIEFRQCSKAQPHRIWPSCRGECRRTTDSSLPGGLRTMRELRKVSRSHLSDPTTPPMSLNSKPQWIGRRERRIADNCRTLDSDNPWLLG